MRARMSKGKKEGKNLSDVAVKLSGLPVDLESGLSAINQCFLCSRILYKLWASLAGLARPDSKSFTLPDIPNTFLYFRLCYLKKEMYAKC